MKETLTLEEIKPYKVTASKFLGRDGNGSYTYEITFNQSIEHTGRFIGIEDGLNDYRKNEIQEQEQSILRQAEDIKAKQYK